MPSHGLTRRRRHERSVRAVVKEDEGAQRNPVAGTASASVSSYETSSAEVHQRGHREVWDHRGRDVEERAPEVRLGVGRERLGARDCLLAGHGSALVAPAGRGRTGSTVGRAGRPRARVLPEAAQPQRVGDDRDARERHRGARRSAGFSRAGGGQRDRGDVVAEGPAEVLLDRPQRRAATGGSRRRPRAGRRETSVRSDASIATSVPVPIARPRSACASAGASLTPSPTIATTPALGLQARARRPPSRPAAPRRSPRRCRPRRRPRAPSPGCRRSAAPAAGRARAAPRPPRPSVGLTVSATTSSAAHLAVPGRDGGAARAPRRRARAASSAAAAAHARARQQRGTPDGDRGGPRRRPPRRGPSRLRSRSTGGSSPTSRARPRRSPGRPGARRRPRARRPAAAPRRAESVGDTTSTSAHAPGR